MKARASRSNYYNDLYELGARYGGIDICVSYPAPIFLSSAEAIYYDITVLIYDEGWPGDDPYAYRLYCMHRVNNLVRELREAGWHLTHGVGIEFDSSVTIPVCTLAMEVIEPEEEQMVSCKVRMTIQRIGDL